MRHTTPSTSTGHCRSLLAALALLCGSATWANDALLVTTTVDVFDGICDSHCSLRDAVQAANLQAGIDLVVLAPGDYLLSRPALPDGQGVPRDEDANQNGDLDIHDALTIRGAGERSRILGGGTDRLLEVLPGATLSLLRLSLEQGSTADNGGAVENHGYLLLREVRVRDNRAVTAPGHVAASEGYRHGQGGGIASYAQLDVHDSIFENNRAEGVYWDDNLGRGGAIFNLGGQLLVRDSLFRGNRVDDQADSGAGGALYNGGMGNIARSLFVANSGSEMSRGGAIAHEAGVLLLSNSTISGNTSGGLSNGYPSDTPVAVLPVTRLFNVSVIDNSGYGLYNWGEVLLRNSLVVGNRDPVDGLVVNCRNVGQSRYRAIGLLLETDGGSCGADLYIDPALTHSSLIHPLADNGGLTRTHALRPASLALDAGIGVCSSYDQRAVARPLDGNGDGVALCDLGAFEGYLP